MKRKINIALFGILFLAGLSLLLYPFVANQWNTYRQNLLISSYDETLARMEEAGEVDYAAQWSSANSYNNALLPSILPDSFAVAAASEEDAGYMSCLNLTGDGMMGYVEIPKIAIKIPILHTTEEEVLERAAGHLEGSSLPVGGENTHAVISAHRGLPSATLFTDLDKLEEGDHFLLYILDDILCYQVDQITVVEPEETGALAVESGKDLVTLLTCTPYGVNSHRLLVRGTRVPYVEGMEEEVPTSLLGVSAHSSYLLWVIVGLAVTGAFILLLYLIDRRRRRAHRAKQAEAGRAQGPENLQSASRQDMQETQETQDIREAQTLPSEGNAGHMAVEEPGRRPPSGDTGEGAKRASDRTGRPYGSAGSHDAAPVPMSGIELAASSRFRKKSGGGQDTEAGQTGKRKTSARPMDAFEQAVSEELKQMSEGSAQEADSAQQISSGTPVQDSQPEAAAQPSAGREDESMQAPHSPQKPNPQPDAAGGGVILADEEDVESILKREENAWKSGGNRHEK